MKLSVKTVFWIVGFLVFLLGLSFFILTFRSDISDIYQESQQPKDTDTKPLVVEDSVNNQKFIVDLSIHDRPDILPFIIGTDVDKYRKNVVITNTGTKEELTYSFSKGGSTRAGYTYNIDDEKQQVNISIFIDDSLNEQDKVYFLNKSYVGALISAAEENKSHKDPTYQPNWDNVDRTIYEASADMYDNNSYYITYEQ